MPVLSVGRVPEFDGVVRMKIDAIECLRMKKPITKHERPFRRLRPELMHHYIIRMHAQQHVGKNRIIENSMMILTRDISHWYRTSIAGHRQAITCCDPHKPTEKRSFAQVVLR